MSTEAYECPECHARAMVGERVRLVHKPECSIREHLPVTAEPRGTASAPTPFEQGVADAEGLSIDASLIRAAARRMRTPAPSEFPDDTRHAFNRVINSNRRSEDGKLDRYAISDRMNLRCCVP